MDVIDSDKRIFQSWGSAEVVDSDGEVIPISEFKKVMPIIMDRGGVLIDTHSNKPIGKILNYEYKDHPIAKTEALLITAKIFTHYKSDDEVWEGIKSGKKKGLSFGGKVGKIKLNIKFKDYTGENKNVDILKELEGYEFSVVDEPANPLATMTAVSVAKGKEDIISKSGDGQMTKDDAKKKEEDAAKNEEEEDKADTADDTADTPDEGDAEKQKTEDLVKALETITSRLDAIEKKFPPKKPDEDEEEEEKEDDDDEDDKKKESDGSKLTADDVSAMIKKELADVTKSFTPRQTAKSKADMNKKEVPINEKLLNKVRKGGKIDMVEANAMINKTRSDAFDAEMKEALGK